MGIETIGEYSEVSIHCASSCIIVEASICCWAAKRHSCRDDYLSTEMPLRPSLSAALQVESALGSSASSRRSLCWCARLSCWRKMMTLQPRHVLTCQTVIMHRTRRLHNSSAFLAVRGIWSVCLSTVPESYLLMCILKLQLLETRQKFGYNVHPVRAVDTTG